MAGMTPYQTLKTFIEVNCRSHEHLPKLLKALEDLAEPKFDEVERIQQPDDLVVEHRLRIGNRVYTARTNVHGWLLDHPDFEKRKQYVARENKRDLVNRLVEELS
jgi:hypothetical protein